MNKKITMTALMLSTMLTVSVPALSGSTSKISAENAAPKVAKVWLLGGQSNAHGISFANEVSQPNMGTVKFYDASKNALVDMRLGFGFDETRFGPEVGMAEVFAKEMPNEEHFILKYAWGDTDLYYDWRSPSMGGDVGVHYTCFINTINNGLKKLKDEGYETEICGMAWVQGENDCIYEYKADAYARNLYNLLHDLYEEFDCEFPVVISGEIEDASLRPYYKTVVRAKQAVAEAMDDVLYMSISDINVMKNDRWHYDGPSMLKAGQKFGTLLTKLNEQ